MINKCFKANISKSGNSNVITIPKYLIINDIVDLNKRYLVSLKEIGDKNGHTSNKRRSKRNKKTIL